MKANRLMRKYKAELDEEKAASRVVELEKMMESRGKELHDEYEDDPVPEDEEDGGRGVLTEGRESGFSSC